MQVLVTGATGFTGSHVVPLLLRDNYRVRCFVRRTSITETLPVDQVELFFGDLSEENSLMKALAGMDALVNIASLGFGHAPTIVAAAEAAGIGRAIFVSTTAVKTTLNAPSKRVRLAAEDVIRRSSLAYTILRPTMIYGASGDRNISRLIRYLHRWPIVPVVGNGKYFQQPVHVLDVAAAIVQVLKSQASVGQTYDISGAAPVTYDELIDLICGLMNRKARKVHLPTTPLVTLLNITERMGLRLPIKAEQIKRLNENKTFDYTAAVRDFNYRPRSVRDGIQLQLEEMKLAPTGRT